MASGSYLVLYTYCQFSGSNLLYETGRSPHRRITITGSHSVSGAYSTDTRITHIAIYRTLASGTVFYREKTITNNTAGGTWWTSVSMTDTELKTKPTLYLTGKGYESKRLYTEGILPPLAFVVEAGRRLWGAGRRIRGGTNEASTLYFSELAPNYFDWPYRNANSCFALPIRGLYEQNEFVYVLTTGSRWRVAPSTYMEGIQYDKLEDIGGCVGHHTIQKTSFGMVWLGQEGFYLADGDNRPVLISDAIRDTISLIDKDRARFAVARYDPEANEYQCWATLESSGALNDSAVVIDFSGGAPRFSLFSGRGKTVYSLASGIRPGGQRIFLMGDHLGNVWQEEVSNSDGCNQGGTYQGTLGYGTTSTTTTTTSTTTTTTTTTSTSTTT